MLSEDDGHSEFLVRTLRLAGFTGVFLVYVCMHMYVYM